MIDAAQIKEQIAELNELLVHVLDEISSLKDVMYQHSRGDRNSSKKGKKGKRRVVIEESEEESESSGEEQRDHDI